MDKRSVGCSLPRRRGFTLIELLVVMGIIAILGALTTLGYRGIAKDAKLSSGKNTVAAVLDNARGLAMKNNRIVLVVFRPQLEAGKQRVEVVAAQWTGESNLVTVTGFTTPQVIDRFEPIPGMPARLLPEGISIATTAYGKGTGNNNFDASWLSLSQLPLIKQDDPFNLANEYPGQLTAVLFAPDGTTITRNTATDSARLYVDFDADGAQDWGTGPASDYSLGLTLTQAQYLERFEQRLESDECWINPAPILAVFDDEECREFANPSQWIPSVAGGSANAELNRTNAYSLYITDNTDPIYFNRYTGVAMK